MRKVHDRLPNAGRASVITAPNLTGEQMDKAVAGLLADVLSAIDRAVAVTAKNRPGTSPAPAYAGDAHRARAITLRNLKLAET